MNCGLLTLCDAAPQPPRSHRAPANSQLNANRTQEAKDSASLLAHYNGRVLAWS